MAEQKFPYTVAAGALSEFIDKLKTVSVPSKIDYQYLKSIGFSSSNHRAFIPLLKSIDLLDQQGRPTERYKQGLRGGDPKQIADGIRAGYSGLFDVYPNAESLPVADLQKFIAANSDYGERAVSAAIKTFQTVCSFAQFSESPADGTTHRKEPSMTSSRSDDQRTNSQQPEPEPNNQGNVTINVNIALSVDATSDPAVYDSFFAAMARHLKVLDGSA